ncbi:hypothetical protein [Cupriavidus pinatubonensis]|uniref:Uncharacterized protein n=1 Tax=Cupriavidus pinatubonensis TaxID=248026 RepID=A0ABM8WRE5_9BURK|nr:hypothetical protein [Cupriavidus pinatubonensis]CAG9170023.1 hypothetical protein LMG23994_01781 [Cupriavidus pinatubonensis]
MIQDLPLYEVPKYNGTVAGGAFAVPLAARNVPKLDLRDLPNPPAQVLGRRPI